jgi:hypothetical protein
MMKLRKTRHLVRAAIVGGLAMGACATTANAVTMYSGSRNHVTIGRAVALPGVVLPRGQYTFEETRLSGSMHVVRVTSRDRSRVYFSGHAWRIQRPVDLPAGQSISLAEAKPGDPFPVVAWFPQGESHGNRFVQ